MWPLEKGAFIIYKTMIKLDDVKSWKNRFQEKLIDITEFQDFEKVMEDERLQTFLNTPLKDLANTSNELNMSYKYLWGELGKDEENLTMKDYLKSIYAQQAFRIKQSRAKFYISESNEIQGLIMYSTMRTSSNIPGDFRSSVSNLSLISFDLSRNQLVLVKDMYSLIKKLLKNYDNIHWSANVDNPACSMYKRVCDKLNGDYSVDGDIIYFEIPGNHFYEHSIRGKQMLELREKKIKELDVIYD